MIMWLPMPAESNVLDFFHVADFTPDKVKGTGLRFGALLDESQGLGYSVTSLERVTVLPAT